VAARGEEIEEAPSDVVTCHVFIVAVGRVAVPSEWDNGLRVRGTRLRCRSCGGLLGSRVTDLPFKIGDTSIVILKSLPVLECRQCGDTELERATRLRVDQLLAAVGGSVELKVVRYALDQASHRVCSVRDISA